LVLFHYVVSFISFHPLHSIRAYAEIARQEARQVENKGKTRKNFFIKNVHFFN
jgi:hypothetical protein